MNELALRLYTDEYASNAMAAAFDDSMRVVYVREGDLLVRGPQQAASLSANSACTGTAGTVPRAGPRGAVVLRFEVGARDARPALATGEGVQSRLTLEKAIELPSAEGNLMRCDRVDFPLGGVAYLHTHQGPGIRCVLSGDIRVETSGQTHSLHKGEAWFESGPDPVFAAASETIATSFVRVMVLPRTLQGKSSIRYVNADDAEKPKTQKYQVFIDEPFGI